jgi:hypothetical protein
MRKEEPKMVKNARPDGLDPRSSSFRKQFHAFLVEPMPGFSPNDWREQPHNYKIVSYEGPMNYRGRADAWLFMQNKFAIEEGATERWAICVN